MGYKPWCVIATKNEAETIGDIVRCLTEKLNVVVVDDSDGNFLYRKTVQEAIQAGAFVLKGNKEGLAAATVRGLTYALERSRGWFPVCQMDAGGSHDPNDLFRLIDIWGNSNAGLVVGKRKFPATLRGVVSRLAALLVGVPDATSGMRVWSPDALCFVLSMPVVSKHFGFQVELLMRMKKNGRKVLFEKIDYKYTNSTFRLGFIKDALMGWLHEKLA